MPAFSETLKIASHWLETYWSQTYPLVDEDAILRRNALNCFADQMAVVDGLRRLPLVSSREHGKFGLREIEIATGQVPPGAGDARPDYEQIKAAFAVMPLEELTRLHESVVGAVAALRSIDAKMRDAAGSDAAPSFEPLVGAARKDGSRAACPARIASWTVKARRRRLPMLGGFRRAGRRTSASSNRGRMRSGRWTRWPTSSGARSRRARSRCSWSARSVWCRRIFSKCWPISLRMRSRRRERQAG